MDEARMPDHIFLWSYMRPSLTRSAIRRALEYRYLKKIIVIIDGPRAKASHEELALRLQTIKVVELAAEFDTRVELWVYGDNLENNTAHIFRTHRRGMEFSHNGIWVEEDMEPNYVEFASLINKYYTNTEPFIISGSSGFDHLGEGDDVRSTLFSPFWLQSLNYQFLEMVEKTYYDQEFNAEVVINFLNMIFDNNGPSERFYAWYLRRFWVEKFESGLRSSFRWDSLAGYALMFNKLPHLVSNKNLVKDLSYQSKHSMNPRNKPKTTKAHKFKSKRSIGEIPFCERCERGNSRVGKNISEILIGSLKYRISRGQP